MPKPVVTGPMRAAGTGGYFFTVKDAYTGKASWYGFTLPNWFPIMRPDMVTTPKPWTDISPDLWSYFPMEVQDPIHEILDLPPPPGLGYTVDEVKAKVAKWLAEGGDQDSGGSRSSSYRAGDDRIPDGEGDLEPATVLADLITFLWSVWLPAVGDSELNKKSLENYIKFLKKQLPDFVKVIEESCDPALLPWGKQNPGGVAECKARVRRQTNAYYLGIWGHAQQDVKLAREGRPAFASRKEKLPKIEDLECESTLDLGTNGWFQTKCCLKGCPGKSVWHTNQDEAVKKCEPCSCEKLLISDKGHGYQEYHLDEFLNILKGPTLWYGPGTWGLGAKTGRREKDDSFFGVSYRFQWKTKVKGNKKNCYYLQRIQFWADLLDDDANPIKPQNPRKPEQPHYKVWYDFDDYDTHTEPTKDKEEADVGRAATRNEEKVKELRTFGKDAKIEDYDERWGDNEGDGVWSIDQPGRIVELAQGGAARGGLPVGEHGVSMSFKIGVEIEGRSDNPADPSTMKDGGKVPSCAFHWEAQVMVDKNGVAYKDKPILAVTAYPNTHSVYPDKRKELGVDYPVTRDTRPYEVTDDTRPR